MIVAGRIRNPIVARQLAGALRVGDEAVLKARIHDREQRLDHLAIRAATQVRDAVLRDDDVAQVSRDGRVAVAPRDAGGHLAA